MTHVDWIIVAIIAISSVLSLYRGFVKEAFSLGSWIFAFFITVNFVDQLEPFLTGIDTPSVRHLSAMAILFIATLIVTTVVSNVISMMIDATGLSGTDRVLGMVFGLGRGFLIVLALVVFVPGLVPVDQDSWWKSSTLIPQFQNLEEWTRDTFEAIYAWFTSFI